MAFIYTQSQFQNDINKGIQNKIGLLLNPQDTMNETVREVLSEVRLRSTRRKASLTPNLFSEEYEYVCPSDLEGMAIIDIPAQAKRYDGEFTLIPTEQFLRARTVGDISVNDFNGVRVLLIDSATPDNSLIVDSLSVVDTGVGEWTEVGGADNVEANSDDYVKGNGSIEFDIDATSTTTAGIVNTALNAGDFTDYLGHAASIFVYARITSATNITNFKLRIGNSASVYFEGTVTVRNDGTAFAAGWNLLRFDLSSLTQTGTVDKEDITYVSIYMTKATAKISEQGYMFNYMIAKKGQYADVLYYTKYGWQSSAGAYKENSTDVADVLVADTDEYDLLVKKGRFLAAQEADMEESFIERLRKNYELAKNNYQMKNPSEDKSQISTYFKY